MDTNPGAQHRTRLLNNLREKNLEKSRNAEVERGNLAKFLTKQSIYVTAAEMDDTIDIRRRKLEVEALQREEALETLTRTAQLEGRRKAFEQAQESALAAELEATRREEESRRREIQRICEADPSLRILQSQLQMAYIQKERGVQLVEKEARDAFEKDLVRQADVALEASRLKALEAERERKERERVKGEERKRVLEAQLEERQVREFISAEEEGKREKALVAAILDKIAAEDAAAAEQAARARADVIRAIEDFKGQRERAVAAALAAEREEHARIAAFIAAQARREEQAKAAKGADAAEREAKYRALVAAEEARRKAQEEEDQLRWILVDNEADRRRKEEEAAKKAREEKMRADFRAANEQQRLIKERAAEADRAKEAALIEQFLKKCQEDDAKEAVARRVKDEALARYKAEVQAQQDVKNRLFEEQKLAEIKFADDARKKEEFRKRVIAEARRKLLQEHAVKLRGFLPRGVFASPADLEILKAFDGNRDGQLSPAEMELAQAAFEAWDPGAAAAGAAGGKGGGGSGGGGGGGGAPPRHPTAQPPQPAAPTAAANRARQQASSITF